MGDHEAGKGLEQIGDDVAAPRLDDPVQGRGHEDPDLMLEVGHLPWGEPTANEASEGSVVGRVQEDDGGHVAQVGGRPVGVNGQPGRRGKRRRITGRGKHVGESGQEPEVTITDMVDRVAVS